MLELLWDVFLDGLLDALKALPFLFGAYLLMEFLEHRAGDKLTDTLSRLGPWLPGLFKSITDRRGYHDHKHKL